MSHPAAPLLQVLELSLCSGGSSQASSISWSSDQLLTTPGSDG